MVGLFDNTKEQGDIILETVGAALRERYGVAKVIMHRKEFSQAGVRRVDRRDGAGGADRHRRRGRMRVVACAVCTTR